MPLIVAIRAHVFAAARIHADDTTVPVLAKGKTRTGRLWTYVRDDRPFGGAAAPAAAFFYSGDRAGRHPEQHLASYAGLMQADAYAGFNKLYQASRRPGPIIEAVCWAHYLEPDFIWSSRRRRQSLSMTAAHRTRHKIGRGQSDCRKASRSGCRLPGFVAGRLDAGVAPERVHRVTLHLKVGGDVATCRGDAGMAEIVADHTDVGSGLQERNRTTVAENVRCDALLRERRPLLGGHRRRILVQNVGDAIAGQRLAMPVHKDMLRFGAPEHAAERFNASAVSRHSGKRRSFLPLPRRRTWRGGISCRSVHCTAVASATRAPQL